jgi:ABC-type nitrate/sulfonate/bicarbonate transport system substrate-binding protein
MKKTVSMLVVVFLLVLFETGSAQEKIRIGIGSVSLQSVLPFIGKQRGLFAKYNLVPEIIYIPGGSTNVQALISGNLDLSQLSGAPGAAANL